MKTKLAKLIMPVIILLSITVFYACQKEASAGNNGIVPAGKAQLSVYLTDGPYDYENVMVDIKSIDVKVDTCHHFGDKDDEMDGNHDREVKDSMGHCDVWTPLDIHPGIYDLLHLRNGLDTLLGSSFIPQGKIKQIKITLGSNNSIMADSIVAPLKIRGNKDYFIINIRNEHLDSIAQNNFQLILDFNLAKSIRFDDGTYWLKPVVKPFCKRNTGEIEGKVRPDSAYGMITAFNSTDTAYALPDHEREGEFKIRGLKEGTYSVLIAGKNGYQDSTINDVKVYNRRETELGKIILHK
ncbi:DUF4382 domain-containing protein [Flavihumibacter profundi]|uniref:DUF4382 domain-containing protein n=1 Tax=Flavihumibacter profundi TaxID=2716883 RepID=UPI001CC7F4F9|nr:DUF4382 domain-containing protein [Flavihumibacter profundi]MBZ5855622.1 DUF4382 domain-containing protein [Flavihumibacter profundi]